MKRKYNVEAHKARCKANYRKRKELGLTTQYLLERKYGTTGARVYNAWVDMKKRVRNARGRNACYAGITIHPEWDENFSVFWEAVGDPERGQSLDRIDGSKNYEPGNVRWASSTLQARNRPRYVKLTMDLAREIRKTVNDQTMTRQQWAKRIGISWTQINKVVTGECWKEGLR